MAKISVQDTKVTIIMFNDSDYISLTDIAKHKSDDPTAVIGNWMRNRNTIEYLGIWESLYNPNFKPLEFEGFRKEAGTEITELECKKRVVKNQLPYSHRCNTEESYPIRDYPSASKHNLCR